MASLSDSPIGSTTHITGHDFRFGEDFELQAFLPHDLPGEVVLPTSTWNIVSEAMAELGRLDAAAELVPSPQLITRVVTRREAVGTSALEGTYANLGDILAAEALPVDSAVGSVPENVHEIMNYMRAAEAGYEWIKDRPITTGMISSLQAILVLDTRSDVTGAGAVRTKQVFIGTQNRRIAEARFVPPPPGDQLQIMFESWIAWLRNPDVARQIQTLVRVAMLHYQFETIHPYMDGNGRLGRLLTMLQLLSEGVLRSPVLSVSPWLQEHASDYRDHLLHVSETGEWAPWIEFFATAVSTESTDGHDRIMKLLALQEELSQQARAQLPRARLALDIADDLIAFPLLSVSTAHERYGKSSLANRNAISQLCETGLLEPYDDAKYDRLFWNPQVFQLIEG